MSFWSNFFNNFYTINISSTSYNGFNFNYTMPEYSAIRNGNYAISTIKRYIKILKDCGNLINTTKNPDVFFNRYLMTIAILNDLILIERKLSFKGQKPSKIKTQLQEKEIFTVNDFLDRYYNETLSKISILKTHKAKTNKIIAFSNKIDEYSIYMTSQSLSKFTNMYDTLENKYLKRNF